MRRRTVWLSLLSVAALAATTAVAAPAASGDPLPPGLGVVASGLVNPTHISFGPGNSLYAADIGTGGIVKIDLSTGTNKTLASDLGFSPGVDALGNGNVYLTSSLGDDPEAGGPARL